MKIIGVLALALICAISGSSQSRHLSGVVQTANGELVPGVVITVKSDPAAMEKSARSDAQGAFDVLIPDAPLTVAFTGPDLKPFVRTFTAGEPTTGLRIVVEYAPTVSASVTIEGTALTPEIEFRNDAIYRNHLFGRDDQLIQTLNAGINAGQHEGGGKSLEIRRFGFNLDHGGVNGGLKILVDDVQQNQATQGHGQGYIGSLKSLSPELVQEVSIINGPFSAAYGDFSGLGVVHIRLKESLPDTFTARLQGGSFHSGRAFLAYSPSWKNIDAYIGYEPSYTDGPFENPLRYRRDNVSGNFTYKFSKSRSAGIRLNFGRNDFYSSGQIPLDLVANGSIGRFDYIDPDNGGRVRQGTIAGYFRQDLSSGAVLKADAFVSRSLFDLFSNFTFFAVDPVYGDEIDQHDSRLQQGGNLQFVKPYNAFGRQAVATIGANFQTAQINVDLFPSDQRSPDRKFFPGNVTNPDVLLTTAHARIGNYGVYIQNELHLFRDKLRLEAGLRFDEFTFDVKGYELTDIRRDVVGKASQGVFQPKLSVAYTPSSSLPVSLYSNYGRGVSSQDARGVVRDPTSPKISITDFYQTGASYNGSRLSIVVSSFLIDRSHEQVYIPDDGTTELAGRSRSYGFETRASLRINRWLNLNGGTTNVLKAFYPGERSIDGTRLIIDSATHVVANASLVMDELRGFNSSLSWRHISGYRLDGDDRAIRASGNDVVDLAVSKRLKSWIDLNFAIDNLLNKKYYETQNYFESRTCPACDLVTRIHATPGYPLTVTAGITLRIGKK